MKSHTEFLIEIKNGNKADSNAAVSEKKKIILTMPLKADTINLLLY
jgi:hypothetical protein